MLETGTIPSLQLAANGLWYKIVGDFGAISQSRCNELRCENKISINHLAPNVL